MTINYNGNDHAEHFNAGESLTVTFFPSSGISSVVSGSTTVPADWGNGTDSFNIPFTTTVDSSAISGQVGVSVIGADYAVGQDEGSGRPHFNVSIDCGSTTSVNTAPSVAFTSSPTTSDEGSKTTAITFSITDPDLGQTWSFATGYPICGTDGTASDTAIDSTAKTGSFKCTFPDGPATRTIAVEVTDSAGADSAEATIGATVANVDPIVDQPLFGSISIDCTHSVALRNISFTDPGLQDDTWKVDIDWGDGSPHTTYDVDDPTEQGAQAGQAHTYNAVGTWTATVTVTDKDGGVGTNTSSNEITVNQTYSVDFLPPFDDSSPSGLIVNTMKNGRTVPVKTTIYDDCARAYVTSPSVVSIGVKKTTLSSSSMPDPLESYADAGASSSNTNLFRWNPDSTSPTGGFWIYNLDSKGLGLTTNSVYRIDLFVGGSPATGTRATVDDWAILQPVK